MRSENPKALKVPEEMKNNFPNLAAVLVLVSISTISGCSSLNSKFDCSRTPGISCKSISEVSTMVDKGQIGNSNNNINNNSKISMSLNDNVRDQKVFFSSETSNLRVLKNHIMRVWMAPYEDSDGNYHEQSYVFAKLVN